MERAEQARLLDRLWDWTTLEAWERSKAIKVAEGTARGNSQTMARIGCVPAAPKSLANTPMFISVTWGWSRMRA